MGDFLLFRSQKQAFFGYKKVVKKIGKTVKCFTEKIIRKKIGERKIVS